jgi:hypothetical protein
MGVDNRRCIQIRTALDTDFGRILEAELAGLVALRASNRQERKIEARQVAGVRISKSRSLVT